VKQLQEELTKELTAALRTELKKGPEEELTEEQLKSVNEEIARFQKRAKKGFLKIINRFDRWDFVSYTPTALYLWL
jgi:hypothetical protein